MDKFEEEKQERKLRPETLFELWGHLDDLQQKERTRALKKHPLHIFKEAELVGKDAEVTGLQSIVMQFWKENERLEDRLKTEEEELKAAAEKAGAYAREKEKLGRQVKRFEVMFNVYKEELEDKDRQLARIRENLGTTEKACVVLNEIKEKTRDELAEAIKGVDEREHQLQRIFEVIISFRKTTPSATSYKALMRALGKVIESRSEPQPTEKKDGKRGHFRFPLEEGASEEPII